LSTARAATASGGATTAPPAEEREPATAPLAVPARRPLRWWWVVAALVLALAVGAVGGFLLGRASDPAIAVLTYGDGGDVPVFAITSTACLPGRLAPGRSFPSGSTVSCDAPHDLEVFETFTPFDTTRELPYPGREPLGRFAASACSLTFGSALIDGPDKDRLAVTALIPSQAAFGSHGSSSSSYTSRDVICVLHAADGSRLTGTRIAKAPG
jgi:hypothetical protein